MAGGLWHSFTHLFGGGGSQRSNQYAPVADQSMLFGLKVVADAIAAGESVGDYSAKNPTSSAHGRYQFTAATDADVSKKIQNYGEAPEDQDKKFAYLASTAYRQQTGRDLAEDAAAGGHEMQIADALKGVWPSVPGGSQQNTSAMAWMRHMIDARAAYGPQARQTSTPTPSQTSIVPGAYTPDPALQGGSAPAAVRSSTTNDNSRVNTSSVETNINGKIGKSLQKFAYVSQSNVGLAGLAMLCFYAWQSNLVL